MTPWRYKNVCGWNSDMSKPINVLTGIDHWLDNLMCNVPELAMCYHDNGIVQVCSSLSYIVGPMSCEFHSQKLFPVAGLNVS